MSRIQSDVWPTINATILVPVRKVLESVLIAGKSDHGIELAALRRLG